MTAEGDEDCPMSDWQTEASRAKWLAKLSTQWQSALDMCVLPAEPYQSKGLNSLIAEGKVERKLTKKRDRAGRPAMVCVWRLKP